MLKFSVAQVLDAALGTDATFRRTAHRHHFNYEPRPDYLYVRSRAISSRCNDNFDEFPADEIKTAYRSFVGKPVFVNHNNADHRRARGVIIDAALHEDRNPDGSPDTWVEVLMEVDAKRFPKLAKAILAGEVDRTSMGTDVAFSKCSYCGNKATTPLEYCAHIPRMKGKRIYRTTASGAKEGVLIREICHGLKFFENSLLVEPPADPTAFFLGVEDGSGQKVATRKIAGELYENDGHRAVDPLNKRPLPNLHDLFDPQRAQTRSDNFEEGNRVLPHTRQFLTPDDENLPWHGWRDTSYRHPGLQQQHMEQSHPESVEHGLNPEDFPQAGRTMSPDGRKPYLEHGHNMLHNNPKTQPNHGHGYGFPNMQQPMGPRLNHLIQVMADAMAPAPAPSGAPVRGFGEQMQNNSPSPAANPTRQRRQQAAPQAPKPPKPVTPAMQRENEWHGNHQISSDNIVHHYLHLTTDQEKEEGDRWYADGHHLAKAMAKEHDTPLHTVAGVISAHSPKTGWHTNMYNASHSLRRNKDTPGKGAVGGEGSGYMSSDAMRSKAQDIMNGKHYTEAMKGNNKTYSFAHLLHHGGMDADGSGKLDMHHVVVDTHALSVAAGGGKDPMHRQTADSAQVSGIFSKNHRYEQAADAYREAAQHLSKHLGRDIAPHQVQAATWLAQRRINDQDDEQNLEGRKRANFKGRQTANDNVQKKWKMHWPTMNYPLKNTINASLIMEAMKLAYGETMAPPDVDTLRDEECPVCAEKDSYDGNECQVCGFVQPPKMFRDPDLDKAKEIDIRKDTLENDPRDPGFDMSQGLPTDPQAMDSSQTDGLGMPGEVPGSEDPGSSQIPIDPTNLDENGQPVDPTMGNDGMPMDPSMLDQGGMPMDQMDPSMMDPSMMDPSMQDPSMMDPSQMPPEQDPQMMQDPNAPADPVAMEDPAFMQDPASQQTEMQDDPALMDPQQPMNGGEDMPPGTPDQGQTDQTLPDGDVMDDPTMQQDSGEPLAPEDVDQEGLPFQPQGPEATDPNDPMAQDPMGEDPTAEQPPGSPDDIVNDENSPLNYREDGIPSVQFNQPGDAPNDPQQMIEEGQNPAEVMGRPLEPGEVSDIYGQPLGNDGPLTDEEREAEGVMGPEDASPGGGELAPDGQTFNPGKYDMEGGTLECPVCGFESDSEPPQSTSMENPMEGAEEDGDGGDGTMAGDVCPQCGEGLLEAAGGMQEGMPPGDADGMAEPMGSQQGGEDDSNPFGGDDSGDDGDSDEDSDSDDDDDKDENPFKKGSLENLVAAFFTAADVEVDTTHPNSDDPDSYWGAREGRTHITKCHDCGYSQTHVGEDAAHRDAAEHQQECPGLQ